MAAVAELRPENAVLARQAEILSRPITQQRRMADAIRALAIDAVEAGSAKSGVDRKRAQARTAKAFMGGCTVTGCGGDDNQTIG